MTRILIGNDFSEDLREDRDWAGWWVQRLIWFARPGDVLVLPVEPDSAFLCYAAGLLELDLESLDIVVPPMQHTAKGVRLSASRLASFNFLKTLRKVVAGRPIDALLALWPDTAIAQLAEALGVTTALAGYGFISQDGGRISNSKSVFRAVAAGAGIPVPSGGVCSTREAAAEAIKRILFRGRAAVVKQDYLSGGRGNEIVSLGEKFRPIGARRVSVLHDAQQTQDFVDAQWDLWTSGGRNRIVIEEYFRDSRAFFAEFKIFSDCINLAGTGEMLSAPFAIGQIMPASDLEDRLLEAITVGGRKLCEALQAMGYRGVLSADAIVTPRSEIYFTEYNGRITGSTHIYEIIGEQIVGKGFGRDRIILERVWPSSWAVTAFQDAVDKLLKHGLAYDRKRRTGVVLTNAHDATYQGVMYCVVAENLQTAWQIDRQLEPLFSRVAS